MDVKELLEKHENLGKQLEKILLNRKITYNEEMENGKLIGKPRFEPSLYDWEPKMFASLRDQLQDVWNFFEDNSYWFDDELKKILLFNTRRLSKKSIIFLLERNVWKTDEIYGAYLIEPQQENVEISYYRFDYKFKTFIFKEINKETRKQWICTDAGQQIQQQFRFLWKRIEIEILTCQEETYHRPNLIKITDADLIKQYDVCVKLLTISNEAALLMLGRLEELWLLKAINRIKIDREEKLLFLAESKGVINNSSKKLFLQIRTQYNLLKHTTSYNIDNCNVENLIKQFNQYLN